MRANGKRKAHRKMQEKCKNENFQNLWCPKVRTAYKYFRNIFTSIAIETVKEDQFFRSIKIKIKIWNVTFLLNVKYFILNIYTNVCI